MMKKYLWNYELNYAGSYEKKMKNFEMTRNSDEMKSVLYDYSNARGEFIEITLRTLFLFAVSLSLACT